MITPSSRISCKSSVRNQFSSSHTCSACITQPRTFDVSVHPSSVVRGCGVGNQTISKMCSILIEYD